MKGYPEIAAGGYVQLRMPEKKFPEVFSARQGTGICYRVRNALEIHYLGVFREVQGHYVLVLGDEIDGTIEGKPAYSNAAAVNVNVFQKQGVEILQDTMVREDYSVHHYKDVFQSIMAGFRGVCGMHSQDPSAIFPAKAKLTDEFCADFFYCGEARIVIKMVTYGAISFQEKVFPLWKEVYQRIQRRYCLESSFPVNEVSPL